MGIVVFLFPIGFCRLWRRIGYLFGGACLFGDMVFGDIRLFLFDFKDGVYTTISKSWRIGFSNVY